MFFFLLHIYSKVKLGYNELGYNELGYNELGYDETRLLRMDLAGPELFVLAEFHCM